MSEASTHWTRRQTARLRRLLAMQAAGEAWVGYWLSDAQGLPCNGGATGPAAPRARAGLVQHVSGPLSLCGPGALHATRDALAWQGQRAWIVALLGEWREDGAKAGGLTREIVGEILPWEAVCDARLALRIGGWLHLPRGCFHGANLRGADLDGAYLRGADLDGAYLCGACLRGADLDDWERGPDGYARRRA